MRKIYGGDPHSRQLMSQSISNLNKETEKLLSEEETWGSLAEATKIVANESTEDCALGLAVINHIINKLHERLPDSIVSVILEKVEGFSQDEIAKKRNLTPQRISYMVAEARLRLERNPIEDFND